MTLTAIASAGLCVLLAGCPPKPQATGGTASVALAEGGVLRLPLTISVGDAAVTELDFSEPRLAALARCIELPLLRSTPDGQTLPGLASAVSANETGTVFKFTLAKASGHEEDSNFLGSQVIAAWQGILRGESAQPLRAQLSDLVVGADDFAKGRADTVSGLSVADGTLSISLTRAHWEFPLWVSQAGLGLSSATWLPRDEAIQAGLAPFTLKKVDGAKLILERNPDSLIGAARLDGVTFICEPDRFEQKRLFREGQLDAANIAALDINTLQFEPELQAQLRSNPTACAIHGVFDHHQFPWGEQEFQSKLGLRQSLNWSLHRPGLSEDTSGQLQAWGHYLPKHMQAAIDPALLSVPLYPDHQRIEDAREGQKLADHEQGSQLLPGMDLAYLTDDDLEPLAVSMLQYWNEVSIKMRPFPLTREERNLRLELGTLEILVQRLPPAYPSPDALYYPYLHSSLYGRGGNFSLLRDAELDELIARAQGEAEPATRLTIQQQLSKMVEEKCLVVFLGYEQPTMLVSPRLGALKLNPYDFDASLPGQDFMELGLTVAGDKAIADADQESSQQ